jgi:hypothetical protein
MTMQYAAQERTMPQCRFYTEPQLVARATTDSDPYLDLAAEIDRDPAIRRLRLQLEAQRFLEHADEIAREPAIRRLRLLLYAARNRSHTATIRAHAIRPPPPPPRRCHRPQAHCASKDAGGDNDAR